MFSQLHHEFLKKWNESTSSFLGLINIARVSHPATCRLKGEDGKFFLDYKKSQDRLNH